MWQEYSEFIRIYLNGIFTVQGVQKKKEIWGDTSTGVDEQQPWTPELAEKKLQRIKCTGDYYLKASKCLPNHQWPEVYEEGATETQQLIEHNPGLRRKSRMKATSAFPEYLINAGFFSM